MVSHHQFPVISVFVMMISKSQEELLDHMGIYLLKLVFCHDSFTLH
jgi:hypothetical protein